MTFYQWLSVMLIGGMMACFLWGRLRYDLVAVLALIAGVATGLVPAKEAFKGFSDDIVIIVAGALIVGAAVTRSGLVESTIGRIIPGLRSNTARLAVLVTSVAVLSAFVKNIGALAMMLPVAYQIAREGRMSPSLFMMPMAFAALLGGMVTLVGTSPNIIVARVREDLTGVPFAMFDFLPVGLCLAFVGCCFLIFGYRLLPADRKAAASMDHAVDISDYVAEVRVSSTSSLNGGKISDLLAMTKGSVDIIAVLRDRFRLSMPFPDVILRGGDTVLLRGDPKDLGQIISRGALELAGSERPTGVGKTFGETTLGEAIVMPGSLLVGRSAGGIELNAGGIELNRGYGINLLAVSRQGERFTQRLSEIPLNSGDIIVLQGDSAGMAERYRELGVLPLATRPLPLGTSGRQWLIGLILAATILTIALNLLPVPLAFFAASVFLVASKSLSPRDAFNALDGPILVMLAALIPVSETLRSTGATDVLASWLAETGRQLPAWGAVALLLVAAMAVTPFLNNAAAVLVMAPIAASFAANLGYRPDPFLMAVAIGAACDFLTPVGHQCNTLVMGPGGYRFGDYTRFGTPLSLLIIVTAVPLIIWFWPP